MRLNADDGGKSLKRDILAQMKRRTLKKGDRILPEEKLAATYGLGIKVVRKALSELESEGVIVRRKRVGTFVKDAFKEKTNIGLLIFDILDTANAYCREIFRGVNDAIDPETHSVQIYPIHSRRIRGGNQDLLKRLIDSGEIDGLLIFSWLDVDELLELQARKTAFVVAGFEYRRHAFPTVLADTENALSKMLHYLVGNGHRDFGFIAGHLDAPNPDVVMAEEKVERLYMRCVEAEGPRSCALKRGTYTVADGRRMMNEFWESPKRPSAIIAHGNELTMGAEQAAREKGLTLGQDITLVGYTEDVNGFPRPLIRNPVYEIGRKSAETLTRFIATRTFEAEKTWIAPEFIFI